MRTKNSIINSIVGLIYKIIQLISAFIVRFFLTRYFINDFIGLEGLYANIVGFFSIVDLGLGTAISFSLYDPIHKKDYIMVNSIMKLYKKVYTVLGCLIILLSLTFVPFLPYFIKGAQLSNTYIQFTFFVYSFGIAITYFLSYKRTLVFALQKNYIILIIDSFIKIISSILQIIAIVQLNSYILYLLFIAIMNFSSNVIISLICKKMKLYNTLKVKKLPLDYMNKLKRDVKALAVTNIFGRLITTTDNILISSLVGIVDLAKNSNYSLIISGIQSLVVVFLDGAKASIGDLIAEKNLEKINFYFERYCFIYYICASFASLGVFFISEPFISIWVGKTYLFKTPELLCIIINLYLILTMQPIATFQNLGGLYVIYQPIVIKAAIINLVLSIILGLKLGLIGIFLGTLISYVYQINGFGKLIHQYLLKKNYSFYIKKQFFFLVVFLFDLSLLYLIRHNIVFNSVYIDLVVSCLVFLIIFLLTYMIIYRNNDNMKYFIKLFIERILKK